MCGQAALMFSGQASLSEASEAPQGADTGEVLDPPRSSSHQVRVVSCGSGVVGSRGQPWVLECLCSPLLLTPISVVLRLALLEEQPKTKLEDTNGKNT